MIAFIKRHKVALGITAAVLIVYYLYRRSKAKAAVSAADNSLANFPVYPQLVYGGGGGVVSSGVTASTAAPASSVIASVPAPAAALSGAASGSPDSSGGTTAAQLGTSAPPATFSVGDRNSYLAYQQMLYTAGKCEAGTPACYPQNAYQGPSYLQWGGDPADKAYLYYQAQEKQWAQMGVFAPGAPGGQPQIVAK